jgi:hypothetical protein
VTRCADSQKWSTAIHVAWLLPRTKRTSAKPGWTWAAPPARWRAGQPLQLGFVSRYSCIGGAAGALIALSRQEPQAGPEAGNDSGEARAVGGRFPP